MPQSSKTPPPLFVLAVLVVLAVLAPAAPVQAAEASPFGIDIHAPTGEELTFLLDRIDEAGIGWVRIDFLWTWIQPAPDVWDWTVYDAIVAAARARGIEIYASLGETPDWATSGTPLIGVPDDPDRWADFCARAARRYRGSIRYWGLWNEPNLDHFWAGSRQQYIDVIVRPGADAIHAANPEAQVGGPELAHLTADDSDWYDWLRDILRQAGDRFDFVTHHVYDVDGSRDVTDKLEGSTVFGNRPDFWDAVTPSVEEVLRNVGWSKPVWLTETGWESGRVSESTQAVHYHGLLSDWLTGRPGRDWVDKIFFYEIKDGTTPSSPSWGILRPDRSAKPAYGVFRDFIAAHQPRIDDALLVSSTFPDTLEAGQPMTVRLTFRNTGTTTWTAAAGYKLGATSDLDPFADPRQLLEAGDSVAPGQEKTFIFPIAAPTTPGTYTIGWRMLREGFDRFGAPLQKQVAVTPAPPVQARTLGLMARRFAVEVSWRDQRSGRAGFGRAVPSTDQTGFFWFFDAANIELVVKVLDGRAYNGSWWVFYGALSDVEYWIRVTDLWTGAVKQYHNPPGSLCGKGDTRAFSEALTPPAPLSHHGERGEIEWQGGGAPLPVAGAGSGVRGWAGEAAKVRAL
ncbi:MAG TPA: NBR1-Ig-like domain-containing protein, partial [Thermoanaerobaculia bacterium]